MSAAADHFSRFFGKPAFLPGASPGSSGQAITINVKSNTTCRLGRQANFLKEGGGGWGLDGARLRAKKIKDALPIVGTISHPNANA